MKSVLFFFMLMIISISCLSQNNKCFKETSFMPPEACYVSFENNIHVFLKVGIDCVYVDFVFWDKYPRQLVSDTLFFDPKTQKYSGKISVIDSRNDNIYISSKRNKEIFFYDISQPIKCDSVEYRNNIKEKNYAIWHELSIEYRERTNENTLHHFFEIGCQRNIKNKLETYSYDEFIKEIEICRYLLGIPQE